MIRLTALALVLTTLAACSESVSPRAERVFYRGGGSASWGTVCKLNRRGFLGLGERGYISVSHVTANGTPLVGPKDAITVSDTLSDWSFLGIDPAKLDAEDYPAPTRDMAVKIHGFPARDRDGEVIPGTLYTDDPVPPFWWVELRDSDEGIAAEGVIGGISGSCVFDDGGNLIAVVHANGFSLIEGTTGTWAKVVPVRDAILQAQGKAVPVATAAIAAAPPVYRDIAPVDGVAPPTYEAVGTPLPSPVHQPPLYEEVAPVFVDPPVYREILPATARTIPPPEPAPAPRAYRVVEPEPELPAPVYHDILPTPRGAYRPRGIECAICL